MENSVSLRDRVLEAARRIVIQEGYGALSMRAVAREIGCSATAIYLYFDSKDALMHSIVDEGMRQLNEILTRAAELEVDPLRRLERMLRSYVAFGLENPEYYEIMFMLNPRLLKRYPADSYRRAHRNLDIIADAVIGASGKQMDRDTARQAATAVWSTVHGVVSLMLAGRIDAALPSEPVIGQVIRSAMIGLGLNDGFGDG